MEQAVCLPLSQWPLLSPMQEEVTFNGHDQLFIDRYTQPLALGDFSFITLTESLNEASQEDGDAKGE